MYSLHPSHQLRALFEHKPWQGCEPGRATFLFVGLDANYDENIEQHSIFPMVLEYHEDGVAFWRQHGVHHPFLLPGYSGDGRRYHQSFARIGFTPEDADKVSFVELLHVPTTGRSPLAPADLSAAHLKWLDTVICSDRVRYVFVSPGVAKLMRMSGCFPWLPEAPVNHDGALSVWHREESTTVYCHLHFSVYGKYEHQKAAEAESIRALVMHYRGAPPNDVRGPAHADEHRVDESAVQMTAAGTSPIDRLLAQSVPRESVRVVGTLTEPKTWGVYEIGDGLSPSGRRFRMGNHPVRERELAAEYGYVRLVALFMDRALADELMHKLNAGNR